MLIRNVQLEDTEQLLHVQQQLDEETKFMLLEPGERSSDIEIMRTQINQVLAQDNSIILVAFEDQKIVGYLQAWGGMFARNRHSVYIVIGILQAYTGRGIGTQLFQALEQWAQEHKVQRLELSVMVHNTGALRLYQKLGFQIEGTMKQSLIVDGQYVDDYRMAKLL